MLLETSRKQIAQGGALINWLLKNERNMVFAKLISENFFRQIKNQNTHTFVKNIVCNERFNAAKLINLSLAVFCWGHLNFRDNEGHFPPRALVNFSPWMLLFPTSRDPPERCLQTKREEKVPLAFS